MVADPFQPSRWDYIYTLQRGRENKADRFYFVVYFRRRQGQQGLTRSS